MNKFKLYHLFMWIVGFIFAEIWRYLLRDINVPEFFKWAMGLIIIIIIYILFNKIMNLGRNMKND